MNSHVMPHERVDDLQKNGLKIIQDPSHFCFGVDAVLLAHFVKLKKNETVLDFCTGTGIIPVLLSAENMASRIAGIDIQKSVVEMAARSVQMNGLSDLITIQHLDVKEASGYFPEKSFDVVTVNPPYMNQGGGLLNENLPKAIARHEIHLTLEDVVVQSAKLLKPGGRLYMVHRPNRLVDLLIFLRQYQLEPKRMRLVQPYAHKVPNMVLVEAVSQGRPMLKVDIPLIIYHEDGTYTDELLKIYGDS